MKTIEERAYEHYPIKRVGLPAEIAASEEGWEGYVKGATEQKAIDIEKFKQWFVKWWELNEYLPLDVCLKSIDKLMEE